MGVVTSRRFLEIGQMDLFSAQSLNVKEIAFSTGMQLNPGIPMYKLLNYSYTQFFPNTEFNIR